MSHDDTTDRSITKEDIQRVAKASTLLSEIDPVGGETDWRLHEAGEHLNNVLLDHVRVWREAIDDESACTDGGVRAGATSHLHECIDRAIRRPGERGRLINEALVAVDADTPNHEELVDTLEEAEQIAVDVEAGRWGYQSDAESYLRGAYSLLVPGPGRD